MTEYWVFQDKSFKRACITEATAAFGAALWNLAVQRGLGTVRTRLTMKHAAQPR